MSSSAGELIRRRVRRRLRTQQARRNGLEQTSTSLFVMLILVVGLTGGAIAAGAMVTTDRYDEYSSVVGDADNVIAHLPRGGSRIYDRHGTLLYEFANSGLRRSVPLAEISPHMIAATVATEDASFWENNGLNTRGLMRAAIENTPMKEGWLEGTGGSSISQQLAKNLFIPPAERTERSVERKLKESAIAIELNRRFSKEQILEWYLNSISYGGVYIGVEAAAQGYFGKPARDLSLPEAALLAGIPQQPSAYSPISKPEAAFGRQHQVLNLMVEHGAVTQEVADLAKQEQLTIVERPVAGVRAPHFVFGPVAEEIERRFGPNALWDGGLEIVTTIDLPLQEEAQRILEKWIAQYEVTSNGHNGALNALDPKTGQVLVYLGSRDYFRDDIQGRNDMNVALRSPGSTLKPFTYLTAFERGWSTGTGVIDVPLRLTDPATGKVYEVRNPIKGSYQGVISAAKALGNSLNVPAVNTVLFAGIDNTVTTLRRAGFTTLDTRPNAYGPAITVGGVNVTLADLVYGYSALAGGGVRRGADGEEGRRTAPDRQVEPATLLKVTDSTSGQVLYEFKEPVEEQVWPESFPYLVTSILSDGNNQCITFGVCGALALPNGRPAAIKTGTSEPFEDRTDLIGDTWAVGYTPQLVAGTWFGNSDNTPMVNIFSTTVSWQAWREFMIFALDYLQLPPQPFARPNSVVERDVCSPSGKLATSLCPRQLRQKALFAAETLQTPQIALNDDWWQSSFGGSRLVLPPQLQTWSGVGAWLARSGLGGSPAPTATPRPSATAGPTSPGGPLPTQPPPQNTPVAQPPTSPQPAPTQSTAPPVAPRQQGQGQGQGQPGPGQGLGSGQSGQGGN